MCCDEAAVARHRRGRRAENDMPSRISRQEALVHMGELSSVRQALEGSALAPGSEATLNALRDPLKRPPVPREGRVLFNLDETKFARNLRSAKRGAAGGPSGMTVEHLQPLLDHPRDLHMFFRACEQLARAQIPFAIQACIRLGRLTALQKPNGGVRVRRLVARTMSQQLMDSVQRATTPYQYTMSTKSGCECIAHALQGLTELDPRATVMSIDGISAYDLRHLTMRGSAAVPFVSMFYGTPSHCLLEDSLGRVHTITQGEGGEQGNAMPMFSMGQHAALERVQRSLREGEVLFAFLDDVYTRSPCLIACVIFTVSWKRVCGPIQASGCTKEKPSSGMPLGRVHQVTRGCSEQRGSEDLQSHRRGIKMLGTPFFWPPGCCAGPVGDAQRTSSHIAGAHSHGRGCAVGVVAFGSLRICSGELCG